MSTDIKKNLQVIFLAKSHHLEFKWTLIPDYPKHFWVVQVISELDLSFSVTFYTWNFFVIVSVHLNLRQAFCETTSKVLNGSR